MKHLLFATLITYASPALAQDPVGTPVVATLIEGWEKPDGTRVSAIRLTLTEGWKTYWRAPGDAGIPPTFDWSGSRNLAAVGVSWPTPEIFVENGMRSVGYSRQVTLPLAITAKQAGKPVHISLEMDVGVCKDICVPQTLRVDGTLAAQGTTPVPSIAAALAEQPYTAQEVGAGRVTCTLNRIENGLHISATLPLPSTGSAEHVVIEAGRPDIWVSEATSHRIGNTLTAQADLIPNTAGTLAIDRSALRFTVLGSSHAVDLRGCVPD